MAGCGLVDSWSQPDEPLPGPESAEPASTQPVQAQTGTQPTVDDEWFAQLQRELDAIEAGKTVPTRPVEAQPAAAPPVEKAPKVQRKPKTQAETQRPASARAEKATRNRKAQRRRPPTPQEAPPQEAPPEEPQLAPQAFGRGDVQEMLEASRQHARLVDDRISALVSRFVDEGLAAMDRGDLEGAHEAFAHAFELDPTDPAAREFYERTGALLDGQPGALGSLSRSAHDRAAARAQQESVLVDHHLDLGRQALAAGNPEQALQHFEDAQAVLRFHPLMPDAGLRQRDVAKLIALASVASADRQTARDAELARRSLQRQEEADRDEATRGARRVRALMDSADAAFLRDDFAVARDALEEVLRIDPGNDQARERKRLVSRALHEQTSRDTREDFRRSWQDTMDELEHENVPVTSVMNFPAADRWAEVASRGGKTFGEAGLIADPTSEAIAARLDELRIPVTFDDVSLDDVIVHLSDVTGVNFLQSQDARDASEDNSYTLHDRAEQPVSRVLRTLLEDLSLTPLTFTIRDNVVWIITQDESRSDYVLEMYDIRDLSFVPTDYTAQEFNLLPSGADPESFRPGEPDTEPAPLIGEDALLTLIQDNIAPDSWTDDPARTITLMPGTLVVNQTPEVHAQIQQLLTDLRATADTMIHIETRYVEVEDSFLQDIGVDLRGLDSTILEDFGTSGVGFGTPTSPSGIGTDNAAGFFYTGKNGDLKGRVENLFDQLLGERDGLSNAGGLWMQALFLDDTDVNLVLRAVTKYETSNVINAPSLTLRSGQRGAIEVLTNRTYVRDFEPEIAQAAVIAQPELDNVKEGVQLDVRAVASADRRFITLEIRPTLAELLRDANGDALPEETVALAGGNASDVTIQLPRLRIQRLRTMATIPDGATLMLGGLKKSVEQDVESTVPFLGDIPFIGFLFKRQGEYSSQRKLLILLKASIIVPQEEEPFLSYRG